MSENTYPIVTRALLALTLVSAVVSFLVAMFAAGVPTSAPQGAGFAAIALLGAVALLFGARSQAWAPLVVSVLLLMAVAFTLGALPGGLARNAMLLGTIALIARLVVMTMVRADASSDRTPSRLR